MFIHKYKTSSFRKIGFSQQQKIFNFFMKYPFDFIETKIRRTQLYKHFFKQKFGRSAITKFVLIFFLYLLKWFLFFYSDATGRSKFLVQIVFTVCVLHFLKNK